MEIEDLNQSFDKVRLFGCGTNISYAITNLGLMYYWGMLVDDQYECQYYPTMFMLPDEVIFTQIKI